MLGKKDQVLSKARGSYAPYRIQNRTGSPILIWPDTNDSGGTNDPTAVKLANNQTVDWRFDDWKTMREVCVHNSRGPDFYLISCPQHVPSSGQHTIAIQFVGKPWEQLRGVPVDREGEFAFSLRPRTEKFSDRLLCEVKVQENVKVVVIRSTYQIENDTLYPLELTLVDDIGHPVYSLEKIGKLAAFFPVICTEPIYAAPGQCYSLPIEAVTQNRIRLQPDRTYFSFDL